MEKDVEYKDISVLIVEKVFKIKDESNKLKRRF
jgi:hypothetical protein